MAATMRALEDPDWTGAHGPLNPNGGPGDADIDNDVTIP